MKEILTILIILNSMLLAGGNLDSCGLDNDPILNSYEAEFLNSYIKDTVSGFTFENKKVVFITGTSGQTISSKMAYFYAVKKREENGSKVQSGTIILSKEEKELSGGYDVIVTFWVKTVGKGKSKRISKRLKRRNKKSKSKSWL